MSRRLVPASLPTRRQRFRKACHSGKPRTLNSRISFHSIRATEFSLSPTEEGEKAFRISRIYICFTLMFSVWMR